MWAGMVRNPSGKLDVLMDLVAFAVCRWMTACGANLAAAGMLDLNRTPGRCRPRKGWQVRSLEQK